MVPDVTDHPFIGTATVRRVILNVRLLWQVPNFFLSAPCKRIEFPTLVQRMMTELWDPERLATAGWIMNRYADFLRPDDRVRIGQEGDPCTIYRSSEEAPAARVQSVQREADGTVRFRAVLEESGTVVDLDNRNISPDRIWELHPSHVETLRDRVNKGSGNERGGELDAGALRIEERLRDMEYRGTEIERTIGGAIREIAGDLMRMYHGGDPVFSPRFAEGYDHLASGATSSAGRGGDRHSFSDDDFHTTDVHHDTDDRHAFSDTGVRVQEGGKRRGDGDDDRHYFPHAGDEFRASGDEHRRSRASRDSHNDNSITPLSGGELVGYSDDVRAVAVPDDP